MHTTYASTCTYGDKWPAKAIWYRGGELKGLSPAPSTLQCQNKRSHNLCKDN